MKRLFLILGLILSCAASAHATNAAVIRHRGCPSGGGTLYTVLHCALPGPTLPNNGILCLYQYGNTANTLTVTDDKSDTLTTVGTPHNDANQIVGAKYIQTATTGAKDIIMTWSSTGAAFSMLWCGEIAFGNGVDVSSGANGSGTLPSPGALVTTVANDLIAQISVQDSTGTPITSWAANSQANFIPGLQQNDIAWCATNCVNQGVQAGTFTASGSITPTMTLAPTGGWNSFGVAIKSGGTGTANPLNDFDSMEHYNIVAANSGFKIGAPLSPSDNLAILECIDAPSAGTITAVSGTVSGSWTLVGTRPNNAGSGIIMTWYKPNATLALNDVLTVTTDAAFNVADCVVRGIRGALASPLDTTITASTGSCASGFCTNTGTQSVGGNLTTLVVTPADANPRFIISSAGISAPQCRGVLAPLLSDMASSPQESSSGELDENNCKAGAFISSAAALTVTWTTGGVAVNGWAGTLSAFKMQAASATAAGRAFIF